MSCEFCGREKELTAHHLIPKSMHGRDWFRNRFSKQEMQTRIVMLCKDCHHAVHRFFVEKELGKMYNTKEALLNEKKVIDFIKWAKKQK